MATITTSHKDPDEKDAQAAYDRLVNIIAGRFNDLGTSIEQVRFGDRAVDYFLGVDAESIVTGATSLGATAPLGALGGSSSTSTPPIGVVDHHQLGVDFAGALAEAGWADPNVGLAYIKDLLNEIRVATVTGNATNIERLRKGLSKFAHSVQGTDLEDDGTLKILAAFAAMKTERDAASAAKTAVETNLTTVTRERDDLRAKLAAVKAKWTALKDKLTASQDGNKFKRGTEIPVTDMNDLTSSLS